MLRWTLLVTGLAALAVALVPVGASETQAAKRGPRAAKVSAKPFRSCGALVRYARRRAARGRGAGAPRVLFAPPFEQRVPTGVPGGLPLAAPPAPAAGRGGAENDGSSPTNVQEAGVDEPDLVKTRGSLIFAAGGGQVHAIDARGAPRLAGSLPLAGFGHQLLRSGDRLLVFSHEYAQDGGGPGPRPASVPPSYGRPVTIVSEVDVSNPASMRLLRTQRVDGSYLTARLNGDTARVVISSPARAYSQPALRGRLRGWMPRSTLLNRRTGRRRTRRLAACRQVRRARTFAGLDMLTVLTVDMSKGLPAVDSDALMTSAEVAYASTRSLYLASQRWTPDPDSPQDRPPATRTAIHRFDISDPSKTVYRASGQVPGYLLNQFSLSEHRGVLPAATTETPTWWGGAPQRESESFVTVLDERSGALAQVGRVGGLGRGERIYAVRFIEDAGFVVTFRQTDPLYTIDLSVPARPRVLGELKIRGFSAYLHPVGGDLLLGVGQDATEQGQRLGTQLSLFDVSDLRRPARLHQRALESYSSSEVEDDHHAFLWWAPARLAVLPVQSYGSGGAFLGAVGFRVARSAGIDEAGRASHQDGGYLTAVRRSFVVRGRLFTLSERRLEANSLTTLAEEGGVQLPPAPAP